MGEETWKMGVDECGSTNDLAADMAREGAPSGSYVTAARQTAGRGRRGRAWQSPPGGLYLSMIFRTSLKTSDIPRMTLAAGVAVCDAVNAYGGCAQLKWPNDVVSEGQKMAGVLVEMVQTDDGPAVVVGVGINITPSEVLGADAVALQSVTGVPVSASSLMNTVTHLLKVWVDRCDRQFDQVTKAWWIRSVKGYVVARNDAGEEVRGTCEGMDADGALVVRTLGQHGSTHHIKFGEVRLLEKETLT